MATTDGRAFYTFVSLLKRLRLDFIAKLPRDLESGDYTALLLTTRGEAPRTWKGSMICYEDLVGDDLLDSALVVSNLARWRKNEVVVGIDPGGAIGVVVFYRGWLISSGIYSSVESIRELVDKLLRINPRYYIIRLGTGHLAVAEKIAGELVHLLRKGVVIELVDEAGTTSRHRSRHKAYRDLRAAIDIAMRRGRRVASP